MKPSHSLFRCRAHVTFFCLLLALSACQEEDAVDQTPPPNDMSAAGQNDASVAFPNDLGTSNDLGFSGDLGGDLMPDQGGMPGADMGLDAGNGQSDQDTTPPGQDQGTDAGSTMPDQGGMPGDKDMGPGAPDDSTLAAPALLQLPSMRSERLEDPALVPQAFDSDYYLLKLRGAEHALIEVNGPPGFEPHIEIFYAQGMPPYTMLPGEFAFVMEGTSYKGVATVRAFGNPAILATEYLIKVDDARNLASGASPVGGVNYTVEVSAVDPLPLNLGGSLPVIYKSSLPRPGEYAWVDVKIENDSILHLKAETNRPGASPTVVYGGYLSGDVALGLNRRRIDLLFKSATSPQAAFRAKPIGDNPFVPGDQSSNHLTFGVADIYGWGSLPGDPYNVTLTVKEYPYPTTTPPVVDELPQNESLAQAQQITLPALIKGASQGQRTPVKPTSDYYTFDLNAGDVIYIRAFGDKDKPRQLFGASVTVLDAQGRRLSYGDQALNENNTLLVYEAPVTQRYILEVAPSLVHSRGSSGTIGFNYLDGSYAVDVQVLAPTTP